MNDEGLSKLELCFILPLQLCHACKRNFEKTGLSKHHCRGCGEGFCHQCSQHKVPVPARSWLQPVRVCNDCHQQLQRESNAIPGKEGAQYGRSGFFPSLTVLSLSLYLSCQCISFYLCLSLPSLEVAATPLHSSLLKSVICYCLSCLATSA